MKIAFSDEVTELDEVVGSIVDRWTENGGLRRAWDDDGAESVRPLWRDLADTGLPGLGAEEAAGGFGLPFVELVPILHRFGRSGVPDALTLTVGAAVPTLGREPGGSPLDELIEQLVHGGALASVQDGWDGYAPWAGDVDVVLVLEQDTVTACRPLPVQTAAGIDRSRRLGRVEKAAAIAVLAQPGASITLRRYLLASTSAALFGLADGLIRVSVDYARLRTQFGRPIGSFQAVAHRLAATYSRYEFTRRMAWYAAWCIDNEPTEVDVSLARAKALAGDVAVEASQTALQVHGGVGYTWESDLHLLMKRVQVLDAAFASSARLWDALADSALGS